ncbi:MAG: PP2C family serine/threonine-protein phosphatase [Desulfosalsimonadaceae bacterium]
MKYYSFTDIGLKRTKNEDAYAVYDSAACCSEGAGRMSLFVVADGIGGHSCGEVASNLACKELKLLFDDPGSGSDPGWFVERIEILIHAIDKHIRKEGEENPACEDMGTTLSALLLTEDFGVLAHVGDSRIYRLRNGVLSQLTSDHTFTQEMVEDGDLSPESAAIHPLRSVLTRAVGAGEPLETVDTGILELIPGDCFLISSDGLHDMISKEEIENILKTHADPKHSGNELLQKALKGGGKDNITGIIIHL